MLRNTSAFFNDGSERPVGGRFLEKRGEYEVFAKTAEFFCTEYSDFSGGLNLWALGPQIKKRPKSDVLRARKTHVFSSKAAGWVLLVSNQL